MSAQPLRPELIARMTAVENFIGGRARPTTADLLFSLKFGRNGTAECLRHLVLAGRIHEANVYANCTKVWAIGRAGVAPAAAPVVIGHRFSNGRVFAIFSQQPTGACA